MRAPLRARLLWWVSLVFVAWMIWAETSFQTYDRSLGQALSLTPTQLAAIGGAFLLPYSLVQIPVGWLLDRWPVGRTATVVAMVNTAGTFSGAVMTLVSGWMLQRAAQAEPPLLLPIYGALALMGVLLAWTASRR